MNKKIGQPEAVKQVLQHLGLWETQKRSPPKIKSPPSDILCGWTNFLIWQYMIRTTPLKPKCNSQNQGKLDTAACKNSLSGWHNSLVSDRMPHCKIFNQIAHFLPDIASPHPATYFILTHNRPHFIVCPFQSESPSNFLIATCYGSMSHSLLRMTYTTKIFLMPVRLRRGCSVYFFHLRVSLAK